jgi:ABC-type amino acid transport system permease subunit
VSFLQKQGGFMTGMAMTLPTTLLAWTVAALVGFLSAFIPAITHRRSTLSTACDI